MEELLKILIEWKIENLSEDALYERFLSLCNVGRGGRRRRVLLSQNDETLSKTILYAIYRGSTGNVRSNV